MRYRKKFRIKSSLRPQNTAYKATYVDVLQDRIKHIGNYERPTWYNKLSDRERNNEK